MARGSTDFLTRSGLRDVVILLCLASALFYPLTSMALVISLLLLVCGTLLHYVTKGVLIRNEVLCKDGIYSIVRHPYYLANYLIDSSFCLLSGNPYLLLLYPFLFFWSYGPTFRGEEKTLTEKHGQSSTSYIMTTPPVFPDRHSILRFKYALGGFSSTRISSKEVARNLRFYAMAALILAFHRIGLQGFPINPFAAPFDGRLITMLLVVAVLYAASVVILKLRKRQRPLRPGPSI